MTLLVVSGCSAGGSEPPAATPDRGEEPDQPLAQLLTPDVEVEADLDAPDSKAPVADVISVRVTGSSEAYTFSVGISSPDEGCELYADWWEVLADDGRLLYRRILTHSHVDEQPFERSGGPVPIGPDTPVWVRAHMHGGGYGGQAMKGSAASGFSVSDLDAGFAAHLGDEAPLPAGCAF